MNKQFIMNTVKRFLTGLTILTCFLLNGCFFWGPSSNVTPDDPRYAPVIPPEARYRPPIVNNGSLFQEGRSINLFGDNIAHQVGDIITVRLNEKTKGSSSAKTDLTKEDELALGASTIPGYNGLLSQGLAGTSTSTFKGDGKSDQSNELKGMISVTVSEVMPNGNMAIRGEKWLTLNQGEEFIRLTGLIRPQDIEPGNVVSSDKIANARISYSGKGQIADVNLAGWFGRFFRGMLFPL